MNIGHAIALQALYGTTLTASKILVHFAAPILIIGIRMTIAGSILLIYQFFTKNKLLKINHRDWFYIIQFAFFNVYLPYVLRYWSLQYLSVNKIALFLYLTPLVSYIIACLVGIETHAKRKWTGIIISFLGFLPSIFDRNSAGNTNYCLGFFSLAEIAMLIAIISQSYSWIVMQKIAKSNINVTTVNGLSMLLGGLLALSTSLIFNENLAICAPWEFAGWLAFVIIVTNIIFYNAQAILLKHFSATIIALTGLCAPLVATLTSALVLHETITWQFILSSCLLAIGVYIFYQTERPIMPKIGN